MWIESDTYIGPCRRAGKKLRLFNRRRADETANDPSIQSLLRQLRSNAQDLTDETKRRRFKLRLRATIDLANRQRLRQTANILSKMDAETPEQSLTDPRAGLIIDRALMAATSSLPVAR